MKRRAIKKCIATLLVGAMAVASIPLSFASQSQAAETNILKGKKTICTYQQDDGHGCRKAVDEKFNTSRWGSSSNKPQAIQIDMGAVYEIDTIKAYLFGKDRNYTYEYYVTMEPTILKENGGNGSDNFVGKNPVVTGLKGVGYGWADPEGKTPTPESEIRSEDYTFNNNKPVGRYLTLRVTGCSSVICLWDIQAYGREVDAADVKPVVIPTGDVILEAENGTFAGTVEGGCQKKDAKNCSNGQYVGYVGAGNTITWKTNVNVAGTYTLDAYFLSEKARDIEVKVNDGAKTKLACQAGEDWNTTVVKSDNPITVKLKAGENTIVVGNDDGDAPNLDCIALTLKEAEKVKPTGDVILEAENGTFSGTFSGGCQRYNAADCSNGQYVGYVGEGNSITWKLNVETAGTYTVDAYFLSKEARGIEIKVNDGAKTTLPCQAGLDWNKTVMKSTESITVKLKAGENTIVVGDAAAAPNLDCIALTLKEADKEPEIQEPTTPSENKPTEPTTPSEDKPTEPTAPSEDKPTEPTTPSENEPTEPTTPSESEPTEPTAPSENEPTEPTTPSENEPTEPTVPGESEPTEPITPGEGEPTEPTVPGESEPTEPTVPGGSEPTEPTKPGEDQTTEPTKPGENQTTEPTKPGEDQTTEPTKPGENQTTEPTKPGEDKPTEPTTPGQNNNQNTQTPGGNSNQNQQSPSGSGQQSNQQTPGTEQPADVSKGDVYWYKNLKYKVTKADATGKGTVELVSTKNKKMTSVTIPASIKIDGKKYNVTSIGKNAFKNCKKLKKIVIKTTQLKKVGKNALKGIGNNAKIKVPSSKLKKYTSLFKGKGQGRNVKITK